MFLHTKTTFKTLGHFVNNILLMQYGNCMTFDSNNQFLGVWRFVTFKMILNWGYCKMIRLEFLKKKNSPHFHKSKDKIYFVFFAFKFWIRIWIASILENAIFLVHILLIKVYIPNRTEYCIISIIWPEFQNIKYNVSIISKDSGFKTAYILQTSKNKKPCIKYVRFCILNEIFCLREKN